MYGRSRNPTRTALEAKLAALEGAKFGSVFASGCAAVDAAMRLLKTGDHVVVSDDVYGGTYRLFNAIYTKLGIEYSFVDLTNTDNLKKALKKNTTMVWLESPTNPTIKLIDLAASAEIARKHGALSVCDNTFMSPYFQRPLELGVDVVLESTTKFLNGHSDVLGGFLGTNDQQLGERIAFIQNAAGAVPGPMDCYLIQRGMKTLHVRMRQHAENALTIAHYLKRHPKIATVIFPGLPNHPQHELAKRQMSGFGSMMSFEVKGGLESARRLLQTVRLFACAESLGGVASLIQHPAIMTHAHVPKEYRESVGITDGLIRLSVGIEHEADLIDDLAKALEAA